MDTYTVICKSGLLNVSFRAIEKEANRRQQLPWIIQAWAEANPGIFFFFYLSWISLTGILPLSNEKLPLQLCCHYVVKSSGTFANNVFVLRKIFAIFFHTPLIRNNLILHIKMCSFDLPLHLVNLPLLWFVISSWSSDTCSSGIFLSFIKYIS